MEKIKAILHDRDKLREAFLYLIFGVLTTLVSWCVYYAWRQLLGLTTYPTDSAQYALIANSGQALAFVLSVAFAFVTNKRLVFRSDKKGNGLWKELGLFFSARVLGWAIFDVALFNLCLALLLGYQYLQFRWNQREKHAGRRRSVDQAADERAGGHF